MGAGQLDPPVEIWWTIIDDVDYEKIYTNVKHVLIETAIPYLDQLDEDDFLYDGWKNGSIGGASEMQIAIYITTIAKLKNDVKYYNEFRNKLIKTTDGRPSSRAAQAHLMFLDNHLQYPQNL